MNYLVTSLTTDSYAKEVKLFGLGHYFIDRYRLIGNTYYGSQRRQVVRRYLTGFLWGNLSTIATSVTYLYAAVQAIAGRLTLGDLTLYTTAAQSVQNSIQGILGGFSGMYEHNLYLNNLFELMDTKTSLPLPAKPVPVDGALRGEIRFEHVSFAYPDAKENALADLSFTISPGETIAIVGRNGAGKTTLFKLICRLYDPLDGRILIDGVDLRDYDPAALRRQIGGMFQDYVTYQATAAENIGLGSLAAIADRDAIVKASRQAGSDGLIDGLPQGYDTALGKWFDAGVNLSGGEWQKVALARAFMRDARILLLDEPTSALDAQAEYDLFERLRSLTRGRTAVYISHRFSTVRRPDRRRAWRPEAALSLLAMGPRVYGGRGIAPLVLALRRRARAFQLADRIADRRCSAHRCGGDMADPRRRSPRPAADRRTCDRPHRGGGPRRSQRFVPRSGSGRRGRPGRRRLCGGSDHRRSPSASSPRDRCRAGLAGGYRSGVRTARAATASIGHALPAGALRDRHAGRRLHGAGVLALPRADRRRRAGPGDRHHLPQPGGRPAA